MDIPEFATGGYTSKGGPAMLDNRCFLVPSGGIVVKHWQPNPNGTIIICGVQDTQKLYDELQTITRLRGS